MLRTIGTHTYIYPYGEKISTNYKLLAYCHSCLQCDTLIVFHLKLQDDMEYYTFRYCMDCYDKYISDYWPSIKYAYYALLVNLVPDVVKLIYSHLLVTHIVCH